MGKMDTSAEVVAAASFPSEVMRWQDTMKFVVRGVVSIHFTKPYPFDTEGASASQATGFIVDVESGFIMTNRHVVNAGPFWGYCVFNNHEQCPVFACYNDPVHDFGFLRFDPKRIEYMRLDALTLRPDLAKVGVDIRVVGNDAGEMLTILGGVISRLDRNAPEYASGYNDFNTPYIQAATASVGGSSGSPVVNSDGSVVAMQASANTSATTSFFLPLDRPLRALECIKQGKPISRGTIQCRWSIQAFEECKRLGLTPAWRSTIRDTYPEETGMLVSSAVLPDGPSHKKVKEGDILLKANGELVTRLIPLDAFLDSQVGEHITLLLLRGGEEVEVDIEVGDLTEITPRRFLQVASATFHDLSYQVGMRYCISVRGVYVASVSHSFHFNCSKAQRGYIVKSINHMEIPDLDSFIRTMKTIPDQKRVLVQYEHVDDPHTKRDFICDVDRFWSKEMKLAVRNDVTGSWDFSNLADPLPRKPPVSRTAKFIHMGNYYSSIIKSFVRVSAVMRLRMDGFPNLLPSGHGLVVDAEGGMVIVSRAIVAHDFCSILVTIADSITVSATVIFLHPTHNYAVVQYDSSLVWAPVQTAELDTDTIEQGDEVTFCGFGFDWGSRPVFVETTVTDVSFRNMSLGKSLPRYQAKNFDIITIDSKLGGQYGNGALVDDGVIRALWMTYMDQNNTFCTGGLATSMILPIVEKLKANEKPNLRLLNAELQTTNVSKARVMGLTEDWIRRVEKEDPERHQLFQVRRTDCGSQGLKTGDIILTLQGRLLCHVQALCIMDEQVLDAVVLRQAAIYDIKIHTQPAEDVNTDRIVLFCGAVLQPPHYAVKQLRSTLPSEVYISSITLGSPADLYRIKRSEFITEVNGVPTPDLYAFKTEANKIGPDECFRLNLVTFSDERRVVTLRNNEHYFPTEEWNKEKVSNDPDHNGWRQIH